MVKHNTNTVASGFIFYTVICIIGALCAIATVCLHTIGIQTKTIQQQLLQTAHTTNFHTVLIYHKRLITQHYDFILDQIQKNNAVFSAKTMCDSRLECTCARNTPAGGGSSGLLCTSFYTNQQRRWLFKKPQEL